MASRAWGGAVRICAAREAIASLEKRGAVAVWVVCHPSQRSRASPLTGVSGGTPIHRFRRVRVGVRSTERRPATDQSRRTGRAREFGTRGHPGPSEKIATQGQAGALSGERYFSVASSGLSPFVVSRDRDASASIRGFVYQVDVTIERWVSLRDGDELSLECGEDIDLVARALSSNETRTLEQVKVRTDRISLRTPAALEALANAVDHIASNPGAELFFQFTTNASVTRERAGEGMDRLAGIRCWEELRTGDPSAADARDKARQRPLAASNFQDAALRETAFRIELVGDLIVDCGHPPIHAEIHPFRAGMLHATPPPQDFAGGPRVARYSLFNWVRRRDNHETLALDLWPPPRPKGKSKIVYAFLHPDAGGGGFSCRPWPKESPNRIRCEVALSDVLYPPGNADVCEDNERMMPSCATSVAGGLVEVSWQ